MPRNPHQTWPGLAFDSWTLMGEATMVVWLRTMRLMMGGAVAEREARRMVAEKITVNSTLGLALMRGGASQSAEALGAAALAHYAKPVHANRERLSRGS